MCFSRYKREQRPLDTDCSHLAMYKKKTLQDENSRCHDFDPHNNAGLIQICSRSYTFYDFYRFSQLDKENKKAAIEIEKKLRAAEEENALLRKELTLIVIG